MTFLELCVRYRSELGIPGSGPSTVIGNAGELGKIVDDIQDADLDVKRTWQDWKFLRNTYNSTTVIGARSPTLAKPIALNMWDERSVVLNPATDDASRLAYIDHTVFDDRVQLQAPVSDTPVFCSWDETNDLVLDPIPIAVENIRAMYWAIAEPMTINTSVSEIPEQFHRIIIARAKIHYGEREDAPEITSGAVAEYETILNQLEAAQLPGQRNRKFASAPTQGVVRAE